MIRIETYGRIQAGKLFISYRDRFDEAIAAAPDCRVRVTVEKIYRRRSGDQNAYLHGVVFPEVRRAMIDAGYSPVEVTTEAVKDFLKHRFAKREWVNEQTGEVMETVLATSAMTTTQMMDFIEEIRRFAGEMFGHYIPAPNEQLKISNL